MAHIEITDLGQISAQLSQQAHDLAETERALKSFVAGIKAGLEEMNHEIELARIEFRWIVEVDDTAEEMRRSARVGGYATGRLAKGAETVAGWLDMVEGLL